MVRNTCPTSGFPCAVPLPFVHPKHPTRNNNIIHPRQPSPLVLTFVYVSLGLLVALDCYSYSVGLMYLPVSTYCLICSSQLAFDALFSFFLNNLKFTPFILNSLVLLTISSVILAFQSVSGDSMGVSKGKYVIGFICTVLASAGYGLVLSLTQLAFKRFLQRETFKVVMDMILCQSCSNMCHSCGPFCQWRVEGIEERGRAVRDGKGFLCAELDLDSHKLASFNIGCVGMVMEISCLFSNAISVLSLPIVPIMAVFLFHDKTNGIKVISMGLAVWGFVSYVHQHYLDDIKSKAGKSDVQKASISDEVNG